MHVLNLCHIDVIRIIFSYLGILCIVCRYLQWGWANSVNKRMSKIYLNIFPLAVINHFQFDRWTFHWIQTKHKFTTQNLMKYCNFPSIPLNHTQKQCARYCMRMVRQLFYSRKVISRMCGVATLTVGGKFIWHNWFSDIAFRLKRNAALNYNGLHWRESVVMLWYYLYVTFMTWNSWFFHDLTRILGSSYSFGGDWMKITALISCFTRLFVNFS